MEAYLVNAVAVTGEASYNLTLQLFRGMVEEWMSTLPLMFKREGLVEKHQIEGVDPSDRYFSRAILVNRTAVGYSAKATYEALTVESGSHSTIAAAVNELIEKLQGLGFTRLRTRANFKGTRYLAEKETWIEHTDRV